MRLLAVLLIATSALAGCSGSPAPSESSDGDGDGFVDAIEAKFGSDPRDNASLPLVERSQVVEFNDAVTTVGTGVPSVQCPADAVNSQVLTWTIEADTGAATRVWVTDLVFEIQGAMTVNDVDLFVAGPDGNELGSATGSTNAESVTVGGMRPPGDYGIEVRGCSGAGDVNVYASGIVHWVPSDGELLGP